MSTINSFDASDGLVNVQARIFGPIGFTMAYMALDTGAEMTLVSKELLEELGYETSPAIRTTEITTASEVVDVPVIAVDRISALGQEQRNFQMLCYTLPPSATVDGLLGLDFLRGMRLVVDFREGLITLD